MLYVNFTYTKLLSPKYMKLLHFKVCFPEVSIREKMLVLTPTISVAA